jgi:hypothetical protein
MRAERCDNVDTSEPPWRAWNNILQITIVLVGLGIAWATLPQVVMSQADQKYLSKDVYTSDIREINWKLDLIMNQMGIRNKR